MFIYKKYDELKEVVRQKVRAGYHYEQLKTELSLDTRFNEMEYRHFLFNFKSAISELRQETFIEPSDVFNLHLARYNKMLDELFTEQEVPPMLIEGEENQHQEAFENFLDREVFIKARSNDFCKLLNTLKQKEDLLGFHRTSIKIVIKNTVKKHREAQDSMLVQKIETRLSNLTLEGQIKLLSFLKMCKISSNELADIRPREFIEAQALSDTVAQDKQFPQSDLEFIPIEVTEEEMVGKSPEEIAKLLLQASSKSAQEVFNNLRKN